MAVLTRRSRRSSKISQINVVPFIDVMLVLLIIFMVTAPLLQQGVEVDLPQAEAEPLDSRDSPGEPIVVTVSRGGEFSLNQGPRAGITLGYTDLTSQVATLRLASPHTQVYVRGDRHVDYGRIMDAMIAVQAAGVERVGLITEPVAE